MLYRYIIFLSFFVFLSACETTPNKEGDEQPAAADTESTFIDNSPLFPEAEPPVPETISAFDFGGDISGELIEEEQIESLDDKSFTPPAPSQTELDFGRETTGLALIALGLKPTIYFDLDSDTLDENSINELRFHVAFLRENPNIAVSIEGHTDEQGSREYNLSLGFRRALIVQQFFQTSSLKNTIENNSYGEERPAIEGHSETAYRFNRRVELYYREL